MSATLNILREPAILGAAQEAVAHSEHICAAPQRFWDAQSYAEEQLHGLVRQIFFSRNAPIVRQVAFSGVEKGTEISDICLRVAQNLAKQVAGRVSLVDANLYSAARPDSNVTQISHAGPEPPNKRWNLVGENLWLVSIPELLKNAAACSRARLGSLFAELSCEFQYSIIQAPPAGIYNEAALLGQRCHGMVLVLHAQQTRRMAASKAKDVLRAANVRLLGTVLTERSFPIPECIYRRL